MAFFQIYEQGNPTGYGSNDREEALVMMEDMAAIYGLRFLHLVEELEICDGY